jgi:hypothetical protein
MLLNQKGCHIIRLLINPRTKREIKMSEYSKLIQKGINRGRPPFSPEQKAASTLRNSLRQEARRRAHLVLKARYWDEFEEIHEAEMRALVRKASVSNSAKSRKTRKS